MRPGTGLIGFGAGLIVAGLVAALALAHQSATCGSTLGQVAQAATSAAAGSCALAQVVSVGGWAAAGVGALLVVVGAVYVSSPHAAPPALPPGWYEWRRDRWRFWDGRRWQGRPVTPPSRPGQPPDRDDSR